MSLIEVRGLGFRYQLADQPILAKLNFNIERGEFVGVVGQNGSGKTTLCNLLRRIIPTFIKGEVRGSIRLDGRDLSAYSNGELAKKVGFVFQNPFIQISGVKKTVYEEIAFGLENLGVPRNEMHRRIDRVLEQFRIGHLKDRHPAQLSGGQSQRVALASVLVMEPEILLVDEPTSQLDPVGTEEVFEALRILKEEHKTILLVEHKMDLISAYADRVLVLHNRGIVRDGKTAEVLADPALEQFGVQMPQVAKLAYRYQERFGRPLPFIPTTEPGAEEAFKGVLS